MFLVQSVVGFVVLVFLCPIDSKYDDYHKDTFPNHGNNICHPKIIPCNSEEKYRRIDGSCNNLKYPEWGIANTTYARILPSAYSDGISAPRKSNDNSNLPKTRKVRVELFPPGVDVDSQRSLVAMQWGQFVAHDMSNLMEKNPSPTCCPLNTPDPSGLCYSIEVPSDDPTQGKAGITCIKHVRTLTDKYLGCSHGHGAAEQINTVTSYLDLSVVYGNDEEENNSLRSMTDGQMNVDIKNHRIFPPKEENKARYCKCNNATENICYKTGDPRMNQSPHLAILHIMGLREHNRLSKGLKNVNPHWDDERIFQEARRINIAQHQHISYYEWLPAILGRDNLLKAKVIYSDKECYIEDYNPEIAPSIINEHAHAAIRVFHSQIAGLLNLMDKKRHIKSTVSISDWLQRPGILEDGSSSDQLAIGLLSQNCQKSDTIFAEQIVDKLFACHGVGYGQDLRSIDIQRDRDHGLSYYNDYRRYCGLKVAKCWEDYGDYISKENIAQLKKLYKNFQDVDLSVGGAMESHKSGSLAGPTFTCIMLEQFRKTRQADRFWFENSASGLTIDQLGEIKKSSISRFFCDNGDGVHKAQVSGFYSLQKHGNLVKCSDLPAIDLTKWKENK